MFGIVNQIISSLRALSEGHSFKNSTMVHTPCGVQSEGRDPYLDRLRVSKIAMQQMIQTQRKGPLSVIPFSAWLIQTR